MPRRSSNTLSLVRKRIRPSFNKTNVYNAVTWEKNANRNTQYRQVFFAKQETRSYHGEHLTETQFRNIFKPENSSVSPLQNQRHGQQGEVPHAMQTFTALERRLDFAVFRSLFASSVRQAAQFIVGGAVQVNGVKISSPSYQLQAGDVFSVDPNRVLEALGRSKPSIAESTELTNRIIRKYNKHLERCRSNPEKMFALRDKFRHRHHVHSQRHLSVKQKRADAHNSAVKAELNNKFMELKPEPVLGRILSGALATDSALIRGKMEQVINLVRGEGLAVEAAGETTPQTTAEQDLAADKSHLDPLSESKKASQGKKDTASEEAVDADKSAVDPLPESKKASKESIPETASEEAVDADKSAFDPLPESKKASQESIPETASEEAVDADKSAVDPLPESKKASHNAKTFESTKASEIASKYVQDKAYPGSRKNVLRLVDEVIKDHRLELREKYHSRLIDVSAPTPYDPEWVKRLPESVQEVAAGLSEEDLANLKIALPWSTSGKLYGLADPSKRWFTPWVPRQFIAPMAVLPHHIEVDFETCNAVYLRDPVARPNHSEVISPFSLEMHERAYMWYFYRRRKNLSRL